MLDEHMRVDREIAKPHQRIHAGGIDVVDLVVDRAAALQRAVGEYHHEQGEEDEQAKAHPDPSADGEAYAHGAISGPPREASPRKAA